MLLWFFIAAGKLRPPPPQVPKFEPGTFLAEGRQASSPLIYVKPTHLQSTIWEAPLNYMHFSTTVWHWPSLPRVYPKEMRAKSFIIDDAFFQQTFVRAGSDSCGRGVDKGWCDARIKPISWYYSGRWKHNMIEIFGESLIRNNKLILHLKEATMQYIYCSFYIMMFIMFIFPINSDSDRECIEAV